MIGKLTVILPFILVLESSAQIPEKYFIGALVGINSMLYESDSLNFKKAVFLTENAYYDGVLNEKKFNDAIWFYSSLCKLIMQSGNIEYTEKDKDIANTQCATFILMTDSISFELNKKIIKHPPFSYNHDDFAGQKDWTNTFVSSLIKNNIGNCHSMPYLYKIIMDELGFESHLALAPNHIYIKAQTKKTGRYNIELTCGDFPTDAWYATSGYIHTDAIRNGIYMRALSDKESVAMTLVDLAQGYQSKFGIGDGSFILKCCDTALEHFPNYINALLLKTEILTEIYKQDEDSQTGKEIFVELQKLASQIHRLGYRKMPQEMYANWVNSLNPEVSNQRVKAILNPRTK